MVVTGDEVGGGGGFVLRWGARVLVALARPCGALVREWKSSFSSRPEMRSISSWIAAVVMRQWSLLLMVDLSHGQQARGDATWDALLTGFR